MGTYDAVVVGAGPAGLAAAAALAPHGRCLVVERGPDASARRRDDPRDLLSGVGGAGLFSDGKHSLWPSATALWALPDRAALSVAFEGTAALLRTVGVNAGRLPDGPPPVRPSEGWQEKPYPSIYVPFEARMAMIETLWASCGERRAGATVRGAGRAGDEILVDLDGEEIRTRQLVIATGRWSPPAVRAWLGGLGVRYEFRRVEFGVRLELDAGHALFSGLPGVDGKLRFGVDGDPPLEIRTFCTCRDGEVVLGEADELRAFSGRADGPRTGRSNVGLLVRCTDPAYGRAVLDALRHAAPSRVSLAEVDGALRAWFGPGAEAVRMAIARLQARTALPGRTRVYGPCIEGVGDYPVSDGSLRIAPGVRVAGDATGRFRGIVASLVSGRYAALPVTADG